MGGWGLPTPPLGRYPRTPKLRPPNLFWQLAGIGDRHLRVRPLLHSLLSTSGRRSCGLSSQKWSSSLHCLPNLSQWMNNFAISTFLSPGSSYQSKQPASTQGIFIIWCCFCGFLFVFLFLLLFLHCRDIYCRTKTIWIPPLSTLLRLRSSHNFRSGQI